MMKRRGRGFGVVILDSDDESFADDHAPNVESTSASTRPLSSARNPPCNAFPRSADGRLKRSLDMRRFDVEPYARRDTMRGLPNCGKIRMVDSRMVMTRAVLTSPKSDPEYGFFSGMSFLGAIGSPEERPRIRVLLRYVVSWSHW
jgi:hypothetical protein